MQSHFHWNWCCLHAGPHALCVMFENKLTCTIFLPLLPVFPCFSKNKRRHLPDNQFALFYLISIWIWMKQLLEMKPNIPGPVISLVGDFVSDMRISTSCVCYVCATISPILGSFITPAVWQNRLRQWCLTPCGRWSIWFTGQCDIYFRRVSARRIWHRAENNVHLRISIWCSHFLIRDFGCLWPFHTGFHVLNVRQVLVICVSCSNKVISIVGSSASFHLTTGFVSPDTLWSSILKAI